MMNTFRGFNASGEVDEGTVDDEDFYGNGMSTVDVFSSTLDTNVSTLRVSCRRSNVSVVPAHLSYIRNFSKSGLRAFYSTAKRTATDTPWGRATRAGESQNTIRLDRVQ